MSRYAAWLRPWGEPGQAAEPSADFDELEADDMTRIGPLAAYVERKVHAA